MKKNSYKYLYTVIIIITTIGCNKHTKLNMNTLHEAVLAEDKELLEATLKAGANPNVKEKRSGNTPLHYAAENALTEEAYILIEEHGAKIDPVNIHGNTPLHLACNAAGDLEIVEMLVEQGANVNKKGTQNTHRYTWQPIKII